MGRIIHFLARLGRRRSAPPQGDAEGLGALATLLGVMFMSVMGFGIIVPLLPFYAQSFDAEPWQIAIFFSAYAAGGFFGEPFWGRMSDRFGRKPLLISTVTGQCICFGLLAMAPNFWFAFFVRLIGGLMSGNNSVVQAYVADVTPPDRRAGRMALLGAAFTVGFILGPAIGGLLVHEEAGPIGFRIPILVACGLSFCALIGVILFVKESRPEARAVAARQAPSREMLRQALRHPVIGRVILVMFCAGFAFTGIESTFGLWAQRRFQWGPSEIGFIFATMGIVSSLCQTFLTGRLSRRYGEARMLAFGMALSVTASFLQIFSTGIAMTTTLMTLTAMGNSVAFPNVSALVSRVTDPAHHGQVLGFSNAAGAISRVAGPLCASFVFAGVSINGPFVLAALVVTPTVFLALAAGRAADKLRSPEPPQATSGPSRR